MAHKVMRNSDTILSTAVGLALFYTWLVSHVRLFSLEIEASVASHPITSHELFGIINAILLFTLFILYLKKRFVPAGKAYLAFIGLALISGYALGELADLRVLPSLPQAVVVILYCLLTNAGMSLFSLEWIRLLGSLGSRTSLPILIGASAIAAGILAVLTRSPFFEVSFIILIFPLGSLAILVRRLSDKHIPQDYGKDSSLRIPYRLLATVFISDCAYGAIEVLTTYSGLNNNLLVYGIGYAGTAILLLVTALYLRFDFNSLIYRIAFITMAVGCVLFALPEALLQTTGIYVNQVGYRFMLALIWILSVWLIDQCKLSANWVFPVVTSIAFVGQFVGGSFSHATAALMGYSEGGLVVCLILAILLPGSALFLLDIRNLQTGWGFNRPIDRPTTPDERFDFACASLAEKYRLTPREAEVFALIAKGYSRAYISERLVLSKETVKSYANKMYAKVGVHTRQDIIELVDKQITENARDEKDTTHSIV